MLSMNVEKFPFINKKSDQSLPSKHRTLLAYKTEFLKIKGEQPNFQEWLCAFIITSIKFKPELLANFLLFMNSL